MTLIVDELKENIIFNQAFRIKNSLSIAHIRPWIYKHGVLNSGVLTLKIYQGLRLLKTAEIDYTVINNSISGTYAHGQIKFDMASLQLNHNSKEEWTEYRMELSMQGYVNSPTFIGAVRRFEGHFYTVYGDVNFSGDAVNDMVEPLGYELFEYEFQR